MSITELNQLAKQLKIKREQKNKTHCSLCFEKLDNGYIEKKYSFAEFGFHRYHKECLNGMEKKAKTYRKNLEKQKKLAEKIRKEVEQNKRPRIWFISFAGYGLKKDYEQFIKDIPKIIKEYNLKTRI